MFDGLKKIFFILINDGSIILQSNALCLNSSVYPHFNYLIYYPSLNSLNRNLSRLGTFITSNNYETINIIYLIKSIINVIK